MLYFANTFARTIFIIYNVVVMDRQVKKQLKKLDTAEKIFKPYLGLRNSIMSFVRNAGVILCILHISCYSENVVEKPNQILSGSTEENKPTTKIEALDRVISRLESGEIASSKEILDKVRMDMTTPKPIIVPVEPIVCREFDYSEWFHSLEVEQGTVGSCTIFGSLGIVEAVLYKKTGEYFDLSERDLFFQQYLGNSGVKEDAIEGLIWRSRSSHTGEAATYDEVFKLILNNGVCLEKERPYNSGSWIEDIDLIRYNVEEMFYYIRDQMAEKNKNSDEITRESREELQKILLKGKEFQRIFKTESVISKTCREQRDITKALLSSYNVSYIDLSNIPEHEEKGRAILEAMVYGPVAGAFGGTPGHAFIIYKTECSNGKLSRLYIKDSDGGNWKATMQDLADNYSFWNIFMLVDKADAGKYKHTYGIQDVK